jgi:hypothetical protein
MSFLFHPAEGDSLQHCGSIFGGTIFDRMWAASRQATRLCCDKFSSNIIIGSESTRRDAADSHRNGAFSRHREDTVYKSVSRAPLLMGKRAWNDRTSTEQEKP